ncbi:hypothetical protein PM082_015979 [Marasmius tenuissimus]|nr:hypothetical protein PM082_015979 [Marasmius tenuissimus]
MASNNPPPLAERVDVHKACRSIENLLSVFNDYCEAAGAIAILQRKLSKALRETAGMKVTGEYAANALNTSATIFEALNEVDQKFAKLADKEYDALSEEVKKWFKKLAKEEKTHDERIVAANNKIKAAGALYEKKSKKNPREANDEHIRYINLISAMGPEISQEKYNHSLLVTQRHSSTTYSIAACVSRLADAEWTKACEGVRRFSPTIGKLGEWRALCEGGWTGSIPQDLPDVDEPHLQSAAIKEQQIPSTRPEEAQDERMQQQATIRGVKPEPDQLRSPSDQGGLYTGPSTPKLSEGELNEGTLTQRPYQAFQDSTGGNTGGESAPPTSFNFTRQFQDDTTGSVRSLSAFPSPPTHYPLPPAMAHRHRQQSSRSLSGQSNSTNQVSFPTVSAPESVENSTPVSPAASPGVSPASSPMQLRFQDRHPQESTDAVTQATPEPRSSPQPPARAKPVRSETMDPAVYRNAEPVQPDENMPSTRSLGRNEQSADEPPRDLGSSPSPHRTRASIDSTRPMQLERSDTGASNGSLVAAMRDRYSHNSGASSPPLTKDIPVRLPQSVSNLASRYDRPVSPPGARPLPSIDTNTRARQQESLQWEREREPTVTAGYRSASGGREPVSASAADEELSARRRHQQRMEQMAELELREKEQELKRREQDIEERARQLERERAQFVQGANLSTSDVSRPRQRQLSFQREEQSRPYTSYGDVLPSPSSASPVSPRLGANANVRPHSHYSASATHLVPPGSSATKGSYRSGDESYISDYRSSNSRDPSVASTTATSMNSSPVISTPRTEKKGWMRRLSMPIVAGNAFLEGKKHSSNNSYGGNKGGLLSLDSKRNGSNTHLSRVSEDGRVNYGLGSGISNRSVTNLGHKR